MTDEQPPVLVDHHGSVCLITLNRPEVRNAIDMPLRAMLAELLEAVSADTSVRAIVITGAGGSFCSGGDVSTMRRMSEAEARPRAEATQRVVRAIWSSPKPVIAAVRGAAYGAGASLALACDRILADSTATFSTAFTGVGLAGDMGIFASLPARVGVARAKQMMLFPAPLTGPAAFDAGLVDALVADDEDVLNRALDDAHRLAEGPARSYAAVKEMLGVSRDRISMLELELEHQVALFDSDDFGEAAAAFAERRRPRFGA